MVFAANRRPSSSVKLEGLEHFSGKPLDRYSLIVWKADDLLERSAFLLVILFTIHVTSRSAENSLPSFFSFFSRYQTFPSQLAGNGWFWLLCIFWSMCFLLCPCPFYLTVSYKHLMHSRVANWDGLFFNSPFLFSRSRGSSVGIPLVYRNFWPSRSSMFLDLINL